MLQNQPHLCDLTHMVMTMAVDAAAEPCTVKTSAVMGMTTQVNTTLVNHKGGTTWPISVKLQKTQTGFHVS